MSTVELGLTLPRFPEVDPERRYDLIIGAERLPASDGGTFRCVDPFENREWGHIASATPADVDRAVAAARAAFPAWRDAPQSVRSAVLESWAELILSHADELARLQVHENGKTIAETGTSAHSLARMARAYAARAKDVHGLTIVPEFPGHRAWSVRRPKGVVAAITPWNNPLGLLGPKLFPGLAVGNTLVIKPSEVTPVSTLRLIELGLEAGLPAGVVNVVTGAGITGKALSEHPDVDKIAFTGSTATGRAIARAAAERFADVSLELGGKAPNIVFQDADIDRAVAGLLTGLTAGNGQACNAGSRVLLHVDVHDEVVEKLQRGLEALPIGDPLDPATRLGPLASRPHHQKVAGYFETAREEGLELVTGGKCPVGSTELGRGLFVEPTLYDRVGNTSRLSQEEIFGPVGTVTTFSSDEEAVQLANAVDYGLTSGFWTRDLDRAHRLAPRIEAGIVWINTWRVFSLNLPFGGVKASGMGAENGLDALDAYLETTAVYLGLDEAAGP